MLLLRRENMSSRADKADVNVGFVTIPQVEISCMGPCEDESPDGMCASCKEWRCAGLYGCSCCTNVVDDQYCTSRESTGCECWCAEERSGNVLLALLHC